MATMRREALWALVCLVTIHVGSVAAQGYGNATATSSVTTNATVDFSSDRARNGTCSLQAYYCVAGTTCKENSDQTRYICYCPDGYDGNGYKVGVIDKATGCTLPGNPVLCESNDNCHQYATCMPFMNDTLSKCECKPGFTGNGSLTDGCININECLSSPCVEHAICKDFPGTYSCECDSSKNFVGDGKVKCTCLNSNCEKLRQDGVTYSYSYVVDPDGPPVNSTGSLEPFKVECKMDENQGITVVNNKNGDGLDLSTGNQLTVKYLEASSPQLDALKERSTGCIQEITFTCGSTDIDVSGVTYNGGKDFKALVGDLCPNGLCKCNYSFIVMKKEELPITSITGNKGQINIGPLLCVEIFPDRESYARFVTRKGVLGEVKLTKDSLTIDPDDVGGYEPLVAKCAYRETVITAPTASKPFIRVTPSKTGPIEQCWNLSYTDLTGKGIGYPQMDALMNTARQCAQKLTLTCSNAVATGMVSYRRCGGQKFEKFVDADIDSTCTCGVTGTCEGGPDYKCNCDSSGNMKVKDENFIISNKRLPICSICMKLEGIEGSGAGVPSSRSMRFDVSELRCGPRSGVKKNCQMYRQDEQFNDLKTTEEKSVWYDTSGKPIIVGCKFFPTPGHAEMFVRPETGTVKPGEEGKPNITVVYRGFNITAIKEAVDSSNYCTQDLLFFCTDSLPNLSGSYGLFSLGKRLDEDDYTLRDLDDEESGEICKDLRFKEACQRCGSKPKRIVVTNKDKLPLTQIFLPQNLPTNLTVGVADTTCAYMEKDCDTILKKEKTESDLMYDGSYVIDPDEAGPTKPFSVLCEFNENVGITKVRSNPDWATGQVEARGGVDGAKFSFNNSYPTASPEQIHSLVQNSEFCWQGVKYECTETPLDSSSTLLDYEGQTMTSFGTVDNSTVMGCACSVLGTCEIKEYRCHCAGKGSMVDQGFVTDKRVLPVTGFNNTVAPGDSAFLTVTDVRCAPSPVDIPKDCAEAKLWKYRHGINYTASGEYLINTGKGRPFLAYCDFTTHPNNPMTVIKPKPTKGKPVGSDNPEVQYQGPTKEQLQGLMAVSTYCYQPVKVDCFAAAFIKKGVRFKTTNGQVQAFWSTSGDKKKATCTCGSGSISLCGGNESLSQQLATRCNCDISDNVWRSDAAIMDITTTGPIIQLQTTGVFDPTKGKLNLTVGNVYCTHEPLVFDECAMGYEECDAQAKCVDHKEGYHCVCPEGWEGKVVQKKSTRDRPMANGRQCIDDEECTLTNQCNEYNSDCVNTPGSYHCDCHAGYRHPPGDKFKCIDINECAENTHDCDENAFCHNIDGSHRCRCKKGYRGNGRKGNCHTGPVSQWSPWGPCSATCGRGLKKRTRTLRDQAQRGNYPLEESIFCYTTCSQGPCKEDTCHNPGQVCEESSTNPGTAECVCPNCDGQPDSPVCAVVGNLVKTFENKCKMRQAACEITKNYILLKNKSCEDDPPSCKVIPNYAVMRDEDGCKSDGKRDIGFCYGTCTKLGDCCQPDFSGPDGNKAADITYTCRNGTRKYAKEKVITKCKCLQKPQH